MHKYTDEHAEKTRKIHSVLQHLSDRVRDLETAMDQLVEQLEPILPDQQPLSPKEEPNTNVDNPISKVTNDILIACKTIETVHSKILHLRNTVEV